MGTLAQDVGLCLASPWLCAGSVVAGWGPGAELADATYRAGRLANGGTYEGTGLVQDAQRAALAAGEAIPGAGIADTIDAGRGALAEVSNIAKWIAIGVIAISVVLALGVVVWGVHEVRKAWTG